jgi:hypothetical protein
MDRIRTPKGKRSRAITKPGTARKRRTELGLVVAVGAGTTAVPGRARS